MLLINQPQSEQLESRPWRDAKAASSDGSRLCASLIHQSLEGGGLVNGQIRKLLAVDLDAGLGEPADKSAVGESVLAAAGVDALDPQSAEIALLELAADIVVLHRPVGRGIGRRDIVLAAAVEALDLLEDFLAAGMAGDGAGGA